MRVVWITGAGKGIGRAVALECARQGFLVAASARTESELASLCHEARATPGSIVSFPLDVTDEAANAATVAAIEAVHGPIDIALLNAGTHIPMGLDDFAVAPFRTLVEVNLMGVVHGCAAVLPRMRGRKTGHLAIVSSVAGYRGLPSAVAYGATKAALINMCEALKPEMDRAGLRLSLINPGFVRTPLTDRNDFPMPFLVAPEVAAQRIVRGLLRGCFEIAFPRRFVFGLKLLRVLPYPLYFALTRRLLRDRP